ncbi:flavoprotein-like protein [Xylariales sp. PMI_506]|nr:flavoprotein-like protein [Xylariales sp. PMI_506]
MGDQQPFKILGLCNGSIGGNSEIVLKVALQSLQEASARPTSVSWIHVPSVMIPRNPKPLKSAVDISLGNVKSMKAGVSAPAAGSGAVAAIDAADDRRAVLDAILDADALVFATPVYSHQPPGFLKAVIDRILGPFADAAFVQRAMERKAAGDPKFRDQPVDTRVLKPRAVGFLVVAGSPQFDQITMALPTLHQFVYPIHGKVVDQIVLRGFASPGSVIYKSNGEAVERARELGRNVASQLGKSFDDAEYLGPTPEGACPHCHLAKFDYFGGEANEIGCLVCGTHGNLVVGEDGKITPVWPESGNEWSCITMDGKRIHCDHIQEASAAEASALQAFPPAKFEEIKKGYLDIDIAKTPLPSQQQPQKPPQNGDIGSDEAAHGWRKVKELWVSIKDSCLGRDNGSSKSTKWDSSKGELSA